MPAAIQLSERTRIEAEVGRICPEEAYAEIRPLGEADIEDRDDLLVLIDVQPEKSRLAVPIGAVQREEGRVFVTVLRSGQDREVPVQVRTVDPHWAEVEGDLEEGDLVKEAP